MNDTYVPVAAFALKSAADMERVHAELINRGIVVQLSHYVGVGPEGILRMVVFATHTPEQIDRLLAELKAVV